MPKVKLQRPQEGPQEMAARCPADEILYGGAAGGGKTWWVLYKLGCYTTVPGFRGLILRRTTPQLTQPGGLVDESRKMYSDLGGEFIKTKLRWTFPSGAVIDFGHMEKEEDRFNYQGGQYDIIAFDQLETFAKIQYLYMPTRLRGTAIDPRTGKPIPKKLISTANPPLPGQPGVEWLIPRFSAWLDRLHPNPAKQGEVRAYKLIDDHEVEVEVGTPDLLTRTFIGATVWDNKILLALDPGYLTRLNMLDKAERMSMRDGDWYAFAGVEANKVMAYASVQRAQEEWAFDGKGDTPLTAIACDVAMGGNRCIIGKRYGNWIAHLEEYPGDPQNLMALAEYLVMVREDERAPIIVDVVGVGAGVVSKLKELKVFNVVAFNGSNKSTRLDKTGHFGFKNLRAEAHWVTREILADGIIIGDDFEPVALPPDSELLSELCAPTWEMLVGGIKIEKKKVIERRLGRSPDKGDTVIMLLWAGSYVPPQMVVEETEFAEEMRSRRESSWRDDL